MKTIWSFFLMVLALAMPADAQITKTATFENYTAGSIFNASFTDISSEIDFAYSNGPGFVIDSDNNDLFNGGNYLTAGGGPDDAFGRLGFIADLPFPSNQVSIDVIYYAFGTGEVTLQGFDSTGALVSGPISNNTHLFTLQINSAQYNITSFQISESGGVEGYDNIGYTYLPEPSELTGIDGNCCFGKTAATQII